MPHDRMQMLGQMIKETADLFYDENSGREFGLNKIPLFSKEENNNKNIFLYFDKTLNGLDCEWFLEWFWAGYINQLKKKNPVNIIFMYKNFISGNPK